MSQHFKGISRTKAQSKRHHVCDGSADELNMDISPQKHSAGAKQMKKEIAQLKTQLASLIASQYEPLAYATDAAKKKKKVKNQNQTQD
ncbi:hypothetical protein N1851_013659 [Merluccius polli]|uniref:Uncharacterized protein n=1 Tax=Merluccius polli TaxID=89951 RepID=A0AA47MVP2_MERPO|nr:hypothetical protein N1851_013659 [Merluccius polli]